MPKIFPPSEWLRKNYTEEVKIIRKGGFGAVYEIKDPKDSILKALKVIQMPKNEEKNEWLETSTREIKILEELKECSHIVKLYDYHIESTETNRIFLIMELAEMSLYDALKIDRETDTVRDPLGDEELIKLMVCFSGALSFALKKNINHRDIKPENVLIMKDGSFKIADWGAGKLTEEKGPTNTIAASCVIGTHGFMAPEVIRTGRKMKKDEENSAVYSINWEKADIFSCGVLLMECCGIYREDLEDMIREEGVKNFDRGIEAFLKEKLKEGLKRELIKIVTNMCKAEPKTRWGIENFEEALNQYKKMNFEVTNQIKVKNKIIFI